MFTQCPECGVAFRVTPEVLKIAAGKVRCGGCGVPFNALEHLSESKPIAHPEPQESAESESHEPSADESSSLLQALDELGGEDVRIEDTGVEWRVVDDGDTNWDDDNEGQPEDSEQPDSEPPRAIDEMLFDDNTVLPDDFDAFLEAPSTSGPSEPLAFEESEPEPPPVDLDLSEPDEWDELLGDLEVLPSEDETDLEPEPESEPESEPEPEPEPGEEPEPEPEPEPEEEPEVTALEAESLSESHDNVDEDELERSIEEDLLAAAFESEAAARTLTGDSIDEIPDEANDVEDEDDDLSEEEVEIDIQIDDDLEPEDDVEDIANPFDDTIEETIATLSMSLNEDPFNDDIEEEPQADAELAEEESETEKESESGEHVIPEMTEEEKTINMLIDQDLFNIAVEDEDGFASTIVQLQPDDKVEKEIADKDSRSKKSGKKDKKDSAKDTDSDEAAEAAAGEPALPGMGVETIIMEGEFVHGGDNEVPLALNREKDDYELRRELDGQNPRIGMYVGLAALVLVLLVQVIHQSRDALATVPAFNSAVGPVYRMLGMPLTPAWDISAWRFEATKGDTDESGEVLTIYSRVGNNSDESLPYPLVHLSLTDRFEDIIGSTVLDPADYLPENSDPRTLVPPGNTFNAVIVIDSPSSDATGFKLNVCYRLASGQLRCADHDFK